MAVYTGQQVFYTSDAVQTTLAAGITSGTSIELTSITGWPTQFPCKLLLEWGTSNQEVVWLTQASTGTGPYTFANCLRGQDGTTSVSHSSGAQANHGVSAGDFYQSMPVFNVCAYGADPTGTSLTSDVGINAALTAASAAGGGIVDCGAASNVFVISQSLQIHSNTWLRGAGATIRAKASFAATQVGSNTGLVMLACYDNGATTVTSIKVTGITFDGNQANISALPGYADNAESSPISLWNCDQVTVSSCNVINAIGYSVYCQDITHFKIKDNYVLTGQGGSSWTNQDGIHITAGGTSQYGLITGNYVNTGTGSAGDDCIALQTYGTLADVIVSGNRVTGGGGGTGISVPLSATNAVAKNIVIEGNDIQSVENTGIVVYEDAGSSGWAASNITITGNSIGPWNANGSGGNSAIALANSWKDVVISGNAIAAASSNANGVQAILAQGGTNVTIAGNRIAAVGAASGDAAIQVGGTGTTTGFAVTGNVFTAGASGVDGILIESATSGTVTGNTGSGNTGGSSYGVHLLTSCVGIAVTGNRLSSFATGIGESGTASSYNTFAGNVLRGNTTAITTSGTGDVVGGGNTTA